MTFSSIFDYPLLLDEIGQYLLPRHLFCSILVSKKWNDGFTPLLWRNIDLIRNIKAESLLHHQQHVISIASLEEFSYDTTTALEHIRLPNLQRIIRGVHFDNLNFIPNPTLVFNLLEHTVSLRSLFLSLKSIPKEKIHALPNALKHLPNLKSLDLSLSLGSQNTTLDLVQQIIYNSRQCKVFHLSVNHEDQCPSEAQVKDFEESIKRLEDIKFQDLKIHLQDIGVDLDFMAPLLERSPLVDSLFLYHPYTFDTLQQISSILKDPSRRPLRFLGIEDHPKLLQPIYWETIQNLFQSVLKERQGFFVAKESASTNISPTIHFEQLCNKYLLMPYMNVQSNMESMLNTFRLFFSDTLTSLKLSGLNPNTFITLLSHLPLLQMVSAKLFTRSMGDTMADDEGLDNISWSCTGMRKLDLHLPFFGRSTRGINKLTMCLFKEIGKLQKLEEWTFGYPMWLLTESFNADPFDGTEIKGSLDYLKNLKALYKLDLREHKHHTCKISAEDITWMVNHWPNLGHLILPRAAIPSSMLTAIHDIVNQNEIILDLFEIRNVARRRKRIVSI